MTVAERMQIAERWQEIAGSRLRIIVHVGHTSLGDARALAAHAAKIGAQGVVSLLARVFPLSSAGSISRGSAPRSPRLLPRSHFTITKFRR